MVARWKRRTIASIVHTPGGATVEMIASVFHSVTESLVS